MALTPGTRLGVYEVTAPLGEGGMGQVWRATDTTLGRQVAIKILPDAFASDPERLARFEREAKTLASLNHPHIAAIYGFENSGGMHALVMELVEGEDLSQRIARGAIPLDEAVPIAKQIAEALETAHGQGVIHRDLKPANIKVRADGTVKVLDFGLAKALDPAAASSVEAMNSPTITTPAMTRAGMILGTAAYMAPEQARGKPVDKRADIWAFGAVLFEMLTGTRAFPGEDVTDTLAAVVRAETDWGLMPQDVTPTLVMFLRRCLQKDPRQRLGDIHDMRLALDGAFDATSPQTTPSGTPAAPQGRLAWIVAAVAVVAAATLALPALRHLRETLPPEPPVIRFTIAPPNGVRLTSVPMVSPDGTRVVFAGAESGGIGLYVRPLDALEAQRLPATEGASWPFWSPDSKSVGLFAAGKLKKIDITGGPAVTICDAPAGRGGAWSSKGVILFALGTAGGLLQVSAAGGIPAPATMLDPATKANSHRWPQFLPDGEHFLYFSLVTPGLGSGANGVFVTSLGSTTSTFLVATDGWAAHAAPGVLLFARGSTLMSQPFDTAELRLTGEPAPVAEAIGLPGGNIAAFSASHTGVLVYSAGSQVANNRRLVWVDRKGAVTPLALAPGVYDSPALSPDGQQVVLAVRDTTGEHIWVYDLARGTLGKRTFDGPGNNFPVWSRDGTFLTFTRGASPGFVGPLMRVRADGSGTPELLVSEAHLQGNKVAGSWSPDGRLLTIQHGANVVVRDADGVFHPTLTTAANEREARFSSNGQWFSYRSNETGRWEVYVQSYPPGNGKWQISTDGGAQAMWAPNGRELFFLNGNRMMAADVELGSAFNAGTPRVLFEMPLAETAPDDPSRYAVTPDAQRFLVLTTAAEQKGADSTPPITVVLNYAQALKR
jgi:serine/threonine protein kinase/Tol biopolymer transport system component